ncbi:MAG TPA: transcription antitermination protein NusB [Candidatus Onthovivens sp.]|nr:transcription antitermination protein NusB [Candidatus Onthovivens sp.]
MSDRIPLSRNKIQEVAMQIMYSFLVCQRLGMVINIEQTISDVLNEDYDKCDLYLKELIIKSLVNEIDTIAYLEPFLKKWKFHRLNYCVQSILILSYTKYKHLNETNKSIIIDIAVNLAKKYSDDEDYKFVNAVLDNCLL